MATTATERKLLLDGEWVETGDWLEVASPYDGSVVARVAKAGAAEARAAVDAAERAMRDPLPAHKRAEILVRVAGAPRQARRRGGATDRRRGGQAAQGGPRRGRAGDVDVHDGSGRGAEARRRDGPDGRDPGGRGQARVHATPSDRRRRRDQPLQLPAQPRRAQDRARARRRLRRRPQAGVADAALRAPPRRSSSTTRACRRLAERPRRAGRRDRRRPRRGRARRAHHLHRLGRRRLEAPRASRRGSASTSSWATRRR